MTGPDKPTDDMIREDEAVTPAFLRGLFSMDDDEVLNDTISTHDGDWIREGDSYHFWRHVDVERDYVNGACLPVALEHFDRDTGKSEMIDVSNPTLVRQYADGTAEEVDVRPKRRSFFKHPDLAAPYGHVAQEASVDRDIYRDVEARIRAASEHGGSPTFKPIVIIESPYAGNVERNTAYARLALADSLARGEAPYASHLLYTQVGVLDDSDPAERQRGMEAGWEFMVIADEVAVYEDLGISEGMRAGLARAAQLGKQVSFRCIPEWESKLGKRPSAPVRPRRAIADALKRLDEIEEYPTYEDCWPWYVRLVRVWMGTEEDWLERHEADRAVFYAAQKAFKS